MPSLRTAWPHHALLSVFVWLWGANFVLAEVALREMAPISFSVARFLMGGAALLVLLYTLWPDPDDGAGGRLFPDVRTADWPRLLVVSVLGAALAPWLGIEGLDLTHSGRASLWLALGPVLSSAIGALAQTERIGRIGYFGIGLAGLGTFVLGADGLRPQQAYWAGDLLLLTALLLTIAEMHLIKPLVSRYGSVPVVALRTTVGGGLYALLATPVLVQESWLTLSPWAWGAILLGGSIGVGVGQWVKYRALPAIGPTRVVIYGNLVPVATLLLAWLTIETNPSGWELLAALLIVAGAFCLQGDDLRSAPASAPQPATADGAAGP
jgi:drug/metabolite transporter (DMT)-like permease